jgi:hypothetical protein
MHLQLRINLYFFLVIYIYEPQSSIYLHLLCIDIIQDLIQKHSRSFKILWVLLFMPQTCSFLIHDKMFSQIHNLNLEGIPTIPILFFQKHLEELIIMNFQYQ